MTKGLTLIFRRTRQGAIMKAHSALVRAALTATWQAAQSECATSASNMKVPGKARFEVVCLISGTRAVRSHVSKSFPSITITVLA